MAAAAALLDPQRVSKLVMVDIAPVQYDTSSKRSGWAQNLAIAKCMAKIPSELLTSRAQASEALSQTVPDTAVRAFLLQNLLPDKVHLIASFLAFILDTDMNYFPIFFVGELAN